MVMGEFSVIPASLPQCGSINVDPNSGSVTTMFQVVCKPKDEKPLEYYLYQDQKGNELKLFAFSSLFDNDFFHINQPGLILQEYF